MTFYRPKLWKSGIIYLKWKLRTNTIQIQSEKSTFSSKNWKNFFFPIFHRMLEDPQNFSTLSFSKFLKNNVKNCFIGTWRISKETNSWILVSISQNPWKWWANLCFVGHNGPTSCEIGLKQKTWKKSILLFSPMSCRRVM